MARLFRDSTLLFALAALTLSSVVVRAAETDTPSPPGPTSSSPPTSNSLPDPEPPDPCEPEPQLFYVIVEGTVANLLGEPIEGARVEAWTVDENPHIVDADQTDGNGAYELWMDPACVSSIEASHPLYLSQSTEAMQGSVASAISPSFDLPYYLSASVSPRYQPSLTDTTVFMEVLTGAPPGETRVLGQSGGEISDLTHTEVLPSGINRWSGSLFVPAGTPDGTSSVIFCAVSFASSGNCGMLSSGTLLSEVYSTSYVVDNTPPTISSAYPQAFETLLSLPTISFTWSDPLAGVESSSLRLWLDGQLLQTGVSGSWVTAPGSGVGLGVHLLEAEAIDRAGNVAHQSRLFTLANLGGSSAVASLREQEAPVNPEGSLPPPQTVTFHNPQVDVDPYDLTLSASTRVGWGAIRRSFTLGQVDVVFDNGTGLQHTVTDVSVPTQVDERYVAALGPSSTGLVAHMPGSTITLPDITVSVPPGFGTQNSLAVLRTKTASLAQPVGENGYPGNLLQRVFDEDPLVTGEIGVCFGEDQPNSVRLNCFRQDTNSAYQGLIEVRTRGSGSKTVVLEPVENPIDNDPETALPDCYDQSTGNGCLEGNAPFKSARLGLVFGCGKYAVNGVTFDLCTGEPAQSPPPPTNQYEPWSEEDGYAGIWLNSSVYRTNDTRITQWQQNHIDLDPDGDHCPNGQTGQAKAYLYRAGTTHSAALTEAPARSVGTDAHPNGGGSRVKTYLGYRTGTIPEETPSGSLPPDSNIHYQLSTDSPLVEVRPKDQGYSIEDGVRFDGFGQRSPFPSGRVASNIWETPGAAGYPFAWDNPLATPVTGRLQLVTGHEIESPTTSYRLGGSLSFQFNVSFSECGLPE